MQKSIVRSCKSHYGSRWRGTTTSIHGRVVQKMLMPGSTLALDCELVYPEIPDLHTARVGNYNNILALNPIEFKYRTLEQLKNQLLVLQTMTLPYGRMFVSFNFQFVNFNRLQKDFYQALEIWINELSQHNIVLIKNFTKSLPSTGDWGDCFFIFENYAIPNSNLLHQT